MSWKRSSHFWPFLSKAALGLLCTGFCCRLRFTGAGSSPGEEADRPNGLLRSAEPAGPCKNSSSDMSEPFAEPALPPTFGLTCAPAPTRTEGSSRTSSMTTTCSSDSSNSTTASSSSSASSSAAAASAAIAAAAAAAEAGKKEEEGEDDGAEAGGGEDGKKEKKEKKRLTPEEEKERQARTLFIGNVPLDWDKKRLRVALREAVGEKYTGTFAPIWYRSEPLKEKWVGNLRKAGSILKEYADDAADAKIAYVVVESTEALQLVRRLSHGLVADKRHTLRADGVGSSAKLQQFDRKRSIFVGNLPSDTGEADLRAVFEQEGEVDAVRVVRDKETKRCKGIAFVLFKERYSVKGAIKYWGTEIKGREIRVSRVTERNGNDESGAKGELHPAEMRLERTLRRRKKSAKAKYGENPNASRKKPGARDKGKKPGGREKRKKTGGDKPKSRKGKRSK
mmetsp:Transcript_3625/g.9530  ORF Transcript_3625/g.9530 Transcript_3625/m.9530 type:complete len:451 (+) Transcript_3625:273-1625(+)